MSALRRTEPYSRRKTTVFSAMFLGVQRPRDALLRQVRTDSPPRRTISVKLSKNCFHLWPPTSSRPKRTLARSMTSFQPYWTFLALTGRQKCTACIQLTGKFEIMLNTRNTNCGASKESISKVELIFLLNGLLDRSMTVFQPYWTTGKMIALKGRYNCTFLHSAHREI